MNFPPRTVADLMIPGLRAHVARLGYPLAWADNLFTADELRRAFDGDQYAYLKEEATRRARARDYWWPWSELWSGAQMGSLP